MMGKCVTFLYHCLLILFWDVCLSLSGMLPNMGEVDPAMGKKAGSWHDCINPES